MNSNDRTRQWFDHLLAFRSLRLGGAAPHSPALGHPPASDADAVATGCGSRLTQPVPGNVGGYGVMEMTAVAGTMS